MALIALAWLMSGSLSKPDLDSVDYDDAVTTGDIDLIERLTESGRDPNAVGSFGLTPLARAVVSNDVAVVDAMLDAGADVSVSMSEGLTAVHVGAQAGSVAALERLIERGAPIDQVSTNGMAPIHHAAATGNVDVVELSVRHGIDINERSSAISQGHGYPRDVGPTALGIAARADALETVEVLLRLGADVDAPSTAGQTPLLIAIFADASPPVVNALLAAGASPEVVIACDLGCSGEPGNALDWAVRLDRSELVRTLEFVTG